MGGAVPVALPIEQRLIYQDLHFMGAPNRARMAGGGVLPGSSASLGYSPAAVLRGSSGPVPHQSPRPGSLMPPRVLVPRRSVPIRTIGLAHNLVPTVVRLFDSPVAGARNENQPGAENSAQHGARAGGTRQVASDGRIPNQQSQPLCRMSSHVVSI